MLDIVDVLYRHWDGSTHDWLWVIWVAVVIGLLIAIIAQYRK